MKKKLLALVLSVAILAVAIIGGTFAYLSDEQSDVNVMTMGNVYIEQHEYERVVNADGTYKTATIDNQTSYVLKDFTQGKPILPIVGDPSASDAAHAGWDTTIVRMSQVDSYGGMNVFAGKNAVDKFVVVENTGKSDAYIRTIVAIEVGSTDGALIGTSYHNTWAKAEIGVVEIDGNNYCLIEFTYKGGQLSDGSWRHKGGLLPAGDTAYPSLSQVYLKSVANNEDCEAIDGNKNGTLDILVVSQAVQSAGFDNAETALNAAFGKTTTTHTPWTRATDPVDATAPTVVTTVEELTNALTAAGAAGAGDTTIYLTKDIDMSDVEWTPINVDGYHGADIVTVNGNGHTITGLSAPLFKGGFAGGSGIVIQNLTIEDSEIVSNNTQGSGAFIECVDSMDIITLDNCHLINSSVYAPDARTGGLVGWTSGYSNVNDGSVKTYINITNCSVINCEITGTSVGAINGHAGASDWTYTTIDNCIISGNTLVSVDAGGWRVGAIIGTANSGEVKISNIIHNNNELKQDAATGTVAPYDANGFVGRFVPNATGKLDIDVESLQTAVTDSNDLVEALANGGNVALIADIDLGSTTVPVPNGITTTLDLNGHVISGVCNAANGTAFTVNNGATLNIKDSGSNGKISYAAGSANQGYAIKLVGNLNLYSGTIELTGNWSDGICYAVDIAPNVWSGTATDSVFNMYGGKVVSSKDAIRVANYSATSYASMNVGFNMEGGEVIAARDGIFMQQHNANQFDLFVTVTGGTIKADVRPIRVYSPIATGTLSGNAKSMTITAKSDALVLNGTADTSMTWHTEGKIAVAGGMDVANLNQFADITLN